jgi:threonine dehydrogenase-like Zn-dependent dehydrogenase
LKLLKEGEKGVHVNSYNLIEEEFDGVGMSCGGKIDVAIEIIEPTSKLLIIGSGLSGLLHVKLAKAKGISRIVATDVNPFRLAMARRFGAEHIIDARATLLMNLEKPTMGDPQTRSSCARAPRKQR